jgi:MoxR-like ATPase
LDAPLPTTSLPTSVEDTLAMLGSADYIADRSLATAVHLALHLKRPLFLEGEAGVGKTEIAKVLASAHDLFRPVSDQATAVAGVGA